MFVSVSVVWSLDQERTVTGTKGLGRRLEQAAASKQALRLISDACPRDLTRHARQRQRGDGLLPAARPRRRVRASVPAATARGTRPCRD